MLVNKIIRLVLCAMAASILISPTPATSAQVAKIEIQAITDSKTGEVEVTFYLRVLRVLRV